MIGFTILIILFTPTIIPIFFEKFIYAIVLIQILSLSLIPVSLNTAYSSKFLGNEQYKIITIATIFHIIFRPTFDLCSDLFSNIFSVYFLFSTYFQNILKIFRKYFQTVLKIFSKYFENIFIIIKK